MDTNITPLMILLLTSSFAKFTRGAERSVLTSRSDDVNPLEKVVMQQAALISQLQARLSSLESWKASQDKQVAFNARLSSNQNVSSNHRLIFDHVDLNLGQGYDKLTGIFTAPVSGLYEFSVKVVHIPPGRLYAQVVKEQKLIAEVEANGDEKHLRDTATGDVAIHVTKGERIWVTPDQSSTAGFSGGHHASSFMGILIQAD